jgi:hypothetical protein
VQRKQIRALSGAVSREGITLVPLQIHFNTGRAKVLLGIAEGRKKADKRATVAERDRQRDKARLMRARGWHCAFGPRLRQRGLLVRVVQGILLEAFARVCGRSGVQLWIL